MPKDNRKILRSVRITGKPLFTDGMEDELSAELDQTSLDRLKSAGVLSGDWKSAKNSGGGISINGDAPSGELRDRINSENMQVIGNQSNEFVPLSPEEAMKRFQEFDFSDEVMRSMQFHKEAIKTKVGAFSGNESDAKNDSSGDDSSNANSNDSGNADTGSGANVSPDANSNKSENDSDDEFPADFPARSKFIKADKTFTQVKEMNREQLIAIDQIAEKTADEVLAYIAELGK